MKRHSALQRLSGEHHSAREFCELAFAHVGLDYQNCVRVDPRFMRPSEVDSLMADPSKAERKLGWRSQTSFGELVRLMVDAELSLLRDRKERGSG